MITALLGISFAYVIQADREIVSRFEGKRWRLPSKIYSDTFSLYPGLSLEKSHLMDRLRRLGYQPAKARSLRKGEYRRGKDFWEIYLHDFVYPEVSFKGFRLRMDVRQGTIRRLRNMNRAGVEVYSAEMEPELITGLFEKVWEERRLVAIRDVPQSMVDAVVAIEDQRFYKHVGVDPSAIARAMLANVKARRVVQGASTLTQQLVKNFFLTPKRSLSRKIREALMSLLLELRYTKDEIMEAYLNEVYFGQKGSLGVYGVGEAAEFYFGKPVRELSLPESALFAGLIRAPNLYSPHRAEERIRNRRNYVLKRMWSLGMTSEKEYEEATSTPVEVRLFYPEKNEAPYFVDFLVKELEKDYSLDILTSEGLLVYTSLDVEMQKRAEKSVRDGLKRLEARAPSRLKPSSGEPNDVLQACLVALEPQTGFIRAMVGGRDYKKSQFNRVTQARRQPGSLFKPIVYVTALKGSQEKPPRFSAASLLRDEPIKIHYDGKTWSPRNFNETYSGEVTLRTALEKSLNCATAWLGQHAGYERIIHTARELGLTTPLEPLPSLVLGAFDAIPLEIASAFSAFVNHGVLSSPRAIKTVLDKDGNLLERRPMELKRAVSPESAFLITNLLKGVIERGTAFSISEKITVPAAGKTGTTNDYRDAWFVGTTSRLLALVWVGFDQPRSIGFSGSGAALPIWGDFMKSASGSIVSDDFLPPPGIVFCKIDRISGGQATSECTDTIREAFIAGTEPTAPCPLHPETVTESKPGKPKKRGLFRKFKDLFR